MRAFGQQTMINPDNIVEFSTGNRAALAAVARCSCYFCLRYFDVGEIEDWIDADQTAECPHCGVDAIVPGEQDPSLLTASLERWFCGKATAITIVSASSLGQINSAISNNRAAIASNSRCSCMACRHVLIASEVVAWRDGGETAVCPLCDEAALVGGAQCRSWFDTAHKLWIGLRPIAG